MPALLVTKGPTTGQRFPLEGERFILGRNPDCNIVIPITSVSREHAHILRVGGAFFIEDMQSRNGTKVNNQAVTARIPLKPGDKIQICDFVATFDDGLERPPLPAELARSTEENEPDEPDHTPVPEATISSQSSYMILNTHPADKLKALLEILSDLSQTLELDQLLPKIMDKLFQLFKQADRGFIILKQEGSERLLPKIVKTRRPQDEINARFSKAIVKSCMESLDALLSDDAGADKRFALSQSVADFRIRSVMCAPLRTPQGRALGVIQLDTQDRNKKFTQDDLKLLLSVADLATITMENARLHHESVARERVRADLELAHQVQLSFLPKELPNVGGYEFFACYEPAQEVGGDYYGFNALTGNRVGIMVGDVAGKGVPAALLMAKLSSETRHCLLTESDPALAISKLNDVLCQHASQMDRFVTLCLAVLDPATHTVMLMSAGHPSPLLYSKATGKIDEAVPRKSAGMPLGMLENQQYELVQVQLDPGDCLLLFSDGVPDAYNVRNEAFQVPGIHKALTDGGPYAPRTAGERVIQAVKLHAAGRSPHDDITLVSFGRTA
jgi:sigma-B regulation protein RsbU (phosphoserine phosphatase)